MRTILLEMLRDQKAQLSSFFFMLSRRSSQGFFFMDLSIMGTPRYFDGILHHWECKILFKWHCIGWGLLKKKSWDFSSLMHILEESKKSWRTWFIVRDYFNVGVDINIVLSINYWCMWGVSSPWTEIRFKFPCTTSALITLPKPSAIKLKRKGEIGSSWWMPLDGETFREGGPLPGLKIRL